MAANAGARPNVIVVGAGPAGLAAALELKRLDVRPIVLERASAPGGRSGFDTIRLGESIWRFDRGAEFVASFYRRTRLLLRELGIRTLVRLSLDGDVAVDGRLYRFPMTPAALVQTPLVSLRSKWRLLLLALRMMRWRGRLTWSALERAAPLDDCSATEFFRERIGDDYVDVMLRGTLDSLTLSPAAETSRVIALSQMREAPLSRLLCPIGGMGIIWEAAAEGLEVHFNEDVVRVAFEGKRVRVELASGNILIADGAIVAVPAPIAVRLVGDEIPERSLALGARYSPALKLHLALERPLPGVRPACPAGRGELALAGIAVVDAKGTGQIDAGRGAVAIVASAQLGEQLLGASDEVVAQRLVAEAEKLLGRQLDGVVARSVVRLSEGVPRFGVGWLRQLATMNAQLGPASIALAGDYLASPSIEGAIQSAQFAASHVAAFCTRGT